MNVSTLSAWQWSVWRAMSTGYSSATRCAISAMACAPSAIELTYVPEANEPPPWLTWMMPSEPASANPRSAAFRVSDEVMLIAG